METTRTTEALSESAKLTEKWFKDASEAMTDIYNKQLNLALSMYNNWSNAWVGAGSKQAQAANISSFFSGPDLGNWNFLAGFNPVNASAAWLDKVWKQALNYNQEMMAFLNDAAKTNTANWEELVKQNRSLLEKRFESLSGMISATADSYRKNLGVSFDEYRKLVEQTNKQLAGLIRQNESFWAEATKTFTHESKQDKSKELVPVDTRKKPSAVAA